MSDIVLVFETSVNNIIIIGSQTSEDTLEIFYIHSNFSNQKQEWTI